MLRLFSRLIISVSIWCPSEAKLGQNRRKSVTVGNSGFFNDVDHMTSFP